MKNIFTTMMMIFLGLYGFSQKETTQSENKSPTGRYFAGITYSWMSFDMELSAMKLHSVWFGSDAGTEEKTQEQIDEINGFIDRNTRINALSLQFGMILLDKPDVRWKLKGSVFGGLAENLTTVTNTLNSVKEYSFNSGFSKPYLGLVFDLGCHFNPTWAVTVRPLVSGTMGKSNTIEDLANPDLLNFNVSKENKYRTLFARVDLLATFTKGKFVFYAGPGLYRIWAHHEYKRVYTQTEEWETVTEEMTTDIVPKNFLDGNIGASWQIINKFTLNVLVGIGNDIYANAGFHFNF
jgi:hypothetical protein